MSSRITVLLFFVFRGFSFLDSVPVVCVFLQGQVEPNDVVIGSRDISKMNLTEAMDRARVLDISLQKQVPMPGIYDQLSLISNWSLLDL